MEEVNEHMGWIRKTTVSEGAVEFLRYWDAEVAVKNEKNSIQVGIKNFKKHLYFILRTEKEILDSQNCECEKVEDGIYVIKALKSDFTIRLAE